MSPKRLNNSGLQVYPNIHQFCDLNSIRFISFVRIHSGFNYSQIRCYMEVALLAMDLIRMNQYWFNGKKPSEMSLLCVAHCLSCGSFTKKVLIEFTKLKTEWSGNSRSNITTNFKTCRSLKQINPCSPGQVSWFARRLKGQSYLDR